MLLLVCLPMIGQASDFELDTTASISFKGENPFKPIIPIIPPEGDGNGNGTDNGNGNGSGNGSHTGNGNNHGGSTSGGSNGGKPNGRLPQTNGTKETSLLLVGTILIALAIGLNHKKCSQKRRETIV